MSMQYIRDTYKVPAKRGARIVFTGRGLRQSGVITSSKGGYLMVRLDGYSQSRKFHPTWEMEYVPAELAQSQPTDAAHRAQGGE